MEYKENKEKKRVSFFTLRLQGKSIRNKCDGAGVYEEEF